MTSLITTIRGIASALGDTVKAPDVSCSRVVDEAADRVRNTRDKVRTLTEQVLGRVHDHRGTMKDEHHQGAREVGY